MIAQRLISTFFEDVYAPLKLADSSENTHRLHRVSQANFARFLGRPGSLDDLSDDSVTRFMAWHIAKGNSSYTANNERNRLLAVWRLAVRKGHLTIYPDVPLLREPKRAPLAWLKPELNRLFSTLRSQTGHIGCVPAGPWWIAQHWLFWSTAERIGAVMAAEWDWYDDAGWLHVPAEARKGRKSDRLYPLSGAAQRAVEAIRHPARKLILPWDRCPSLLWLRYKRILKTAGLPAGRRSMFHRMRRSVASHFEAAGGNATELLDHSSRTVTKGYLDPRIVSQPQPSDLLFDPTEGDDKPLPPPIG